jgi:hypothetical protein
MTTSKSTTVTVPAARYADADDCLAAAEQDYAAEHDLAGWDLAPQWADDQRDEIVLTVPAWSAPATVEDFEQALDVALASADATRLRALSAKIKRVAWNGAAQAQAAEIAKRALDEANRLTDAAAQ